MKHLLFLGVAFAAFCVSHSNPPDFCQLEHDEGQGLSFTFALYYDPVRDRCIPFLFKGEGGNANRFLNERECIRNCSINAENLYPMDETAGKTRVSMSVSNAPPSGERAGLLTQDRWKLSQACHFKKAAGGCQAQHLRYYYDSLHDKCKKFLWTGCFGNGNRFFDQGSCNATCDGIHDEGDEEEEVESDTPIAIICGVLLAVIVAGIFITVIVLTIQSKKKNPKKKSSGKSKDPQTDVPLQEKGTEVA